MVDLKFLSPVSSNPKMADTSVILLKSRFRIYIYYLKIQRINHWNWRFSTRISTKWWCLICWQMTSQRALMSEASARMFQSRWLRKTQNLDNLFKSKATITGPIQQSLKRAKFWGWYIYIYHPPTWSESRDAPGFKLALRESYFADRAEGRDKHDQCDKNCLR